jgi:hypothetical protein
MQPHVKSNRAAAAQESIAKLVVGELEAIDVELTTHAHFFLGDAER